MTYTEPKRCPLCDEPESLCECYQPLLTLTEWMQQNPVKALRRLVEAERRNFLYEMELQSLRKQIRTDSGEPVSE